MDVPTVDQVARKLQTARRRGASDDITLYSNQLLYLCHQHVSEANELQQHDRAAHYLSIAADVLEQLPDTEPDSTSVELNAITRDLEYISCLYQNINRVIDSQAPLVDHISRTTERTDARLERAERAMLTYFATTPSTTSYLSTLGLVVLVGFVVVVLVLT